MNESMAHRATRDAKVRDRSCRVRMISTVALLASGLLAASANAEYTRPAPDDGSAPTAADLMLYEGASRTLTVQVLNLTPYNIDFEQQPGQSWSITATDEAAMVDRNRMTKKSFMFAPVGVPVRIPAAPSQNFEAPTIVVNGQTVPNPNYKADYIDTVTHPYPLLLSWDDEGGFERDHWLSWKIRNVGWWKCNSFDPSSICEYRYQDVGLGLWMFRNEPSGPMNSGYLTEIVAGLKTVFVTVKLVAEWIDPVAWMNEFLALERLADETRDFIEENKQPNDGYRMWVASYVIPHPDSTCGSPTSDCAPTLMKPENTGDGIYVNWSASAAGPKDADGTAPEYAAEELLTVSVHIFRGHDAKQCDPLYYPNKCPLGMEPIVMVTVMRATDFSIAQLVREDSIPSKTSQAGQQSRRFLAQAGAVRIRQLLKGKGTYGLDVLKGVLADMHPARVQVLLGMIRDMHSGRLPTTQERRLVQEIASELQARLK